MGDFMTVISVTCFTRNDISKSDLDKIRSELGEDIFAAQYQQYPSQPTGHMIKRDNLQRYDQLPIRNEITLRHSKLGHGHQS